MSIKKKIAKMSVHHILNFEDVPTFVNSLRIVYSCYGDKGSNVFIGWVYNQILEIASSSQKPGCDV